jgi:hypothetical protein
VEFVGDDLPILHEADSAAFALHPAMTSDMNALITKPQITRQLFDEYR